MRGGLGAYEPHRSGCFVQILLVSRQVGFHPTWTLVLSYSMSGIRPFCGHDGVRITLAYGLRRCAAESNCFRLDLVILIDRPQARRCPFVPLPHWQQCAYDSPSVSRGSFVKGDDHGLLTILRCTGICPQGLAMRHIHIEPGLRLRFAGRDEAFNEGVEIGLLAAHMAACIGEVTATLASTILN